MSVFCFQELLVILFPVIVVIPSARKTKIMTATAAMTVLWAIKEPGGTRPVITPTWTVCIITENTHQTLMVSTGITGKDITTPPRELRWKSDQSSFKNFCSLLFCLVKVKVENKCSSDWLIKKWKVLLRHFLLCCFLHSFHFPLCTLFYFLFFPFFRFPSLMSRYYVLLRENNVSRVPENNIYIFEHTLRTLTEFTWFLKRGTLALITGHFFICCSKSIDWIFHEKCFSIFGFTCTHL